MAETIWQLWLISLGSGNLDRVLFFEWLLWMKKETANFCMFRAYRNYITCVFPYREVLMKYEIWNYYVSIIHYCVDSCLISISWSYYTVHLVYYLHLGFSLRGLDFWTTLQTWEYYSCFSYQTSLDLWIKNEHTASTLLVQVIFIYFFSFCIFTSCSSISLKNKNCHYICNCNKKFPHIFFVLVGSIKGHICTFNALLRSK